MYVLVLPVSGGGFVSQLGILQHLCESHFIPDLTLSSSGGNVAAYVAAAANWKWPAIERIARELSQDLFSRPWNSVSSLALVIGYFKGNVYNKGNGVHDFLLRHFTESSITKYEIWTGTYNKNRQKARLFCNRSNKIKNMPTEDDETVSNKKSFPHSVSIDENKVKNTSTKSISKIETSIMDISCIDYDLTQSIDPIFAAGKIELIADAGVASASIPAIVPAQKIMDEDYSDGGIAGASPLSIMQEPILKYARDNNVPLHIVYINSVDLSNPRVKPIHNILDTWKQATNDMIRSQTVIDRLSGYELLRCHPGIMNKEEFICNYENIERVKLIQARVNYSMLEIYPTDRFDVELANFNGNDVISAIHMAYKNCRCRLWWISPSDSLCDPDVCHLLDACKNCLQ